MRRPTFPALGITATLLAAALSTHTAHAASL